MRPGSGVVPGRILKTSTIQNFESNFTHSGDAMETENIFSGLKVLDLASFIAGPGAATVLGDFGADVIKVEPPGAGDPHRNTYKIPPQPRSKDNYAWHLDNRNKRGVAVDLKSPHARTILERLIKWADVVVINFPPPYGNV